LRNAVFLKNDHVFQLFVQFFGAFFGSLLSRATLSSTVFTDVFISLGVLRRSVDVNFPIPSDQAQSDYATVFANGDGAFSNRFQVEFS
jgi:hypothetical protein